jgi:hypothetical protein
MPTEAEPKDVQDINALQGHYSKKSDELRTLNDAQFGIKSELINGEWVRDATDSQLLEKRISHDDPKIEANNMLLRCLSRLRAIDYAMAQKTPKNALATERLFLKITFEALVTDIDTWLIADDPKATLKLLEETFDTALIQALHDADMTQGCYTKDDAKALLTHYQNLSSLIDDARPLVTITKDWQTQIYHRETQYPVTEKTEAQRKAIEAHYVDATDNTAIQMADFLFKDRLVSHKTLLPAQTRKTHLEGVKNAYVCKNEVFQKTYAHNKKDEQEMVMATHWSARAASLVYLGDHATDAEVLLHTKENITQLNSAIAKRRGDNTYNQLHISCLNTNSSIENQDKIVSTLREATTDSTSASMSYIPTNTLGLLDSVALSSKIPNTSIINSRDKSKRDRVMKATAVGLLANKLPNTTEVTTCASGQNRTNTKHAKETDQWINQVYKEYEINPDNIENTRAMGGNAAENTSHLLPGSPGMKEDSNAGVFGKEATEQYYRRSANTNKKAPLGKVDFLSRPSALAELRFKENCKKFEAAITTFPGEKAAPRNFLTAIKSLNTPKINGKQLSDLNTLLEQGLLAVKSINTSDANKLERIAQKISKKSTSKAWKALCLLAIVFAEALVTIGNALVIAAAYILNKPSAIKQSISRMDASKTAVTTAFKEVTSKKPNDFSSNRHSAPEF